MLICSTWLHTTPRDHNSLLFWTFNEGEHSFFTCRWSDSREYYKNPTGRLRSRDHPAVSFLYSELLVLDNNIRKSFLQQAHTRKLISDKNILIVSVETFCIFQSYSFHSGLRFQDCWQFHLVLFMREVSLYINVCCLLHLPLQRPSLLR